MKIALVFDSLGCGGAEILGVHFAREAGRYGVEPLIVSLQPLETNHLTRQLDQIGTAVETVPGSGLLKPRRVMHLARRFREFEPDVVVTHLLYSNIIGSAAARLAGVPCVSTLHNVRAEQKDFHPLKPLIEGVCLRRFVREVIAVGYTVADTHRDRLGRTPIQVVPNCAAELAPISGHHRSSLRQELMNDPSRLLLLSVGRLVEAKGFPFLFDAFHELSDTYRRAELVVVGEGDLEDELRERVADLGLSDRIHLTGYRNDVAAIMASADVFVSSSLFEGLPLVLLEAMAAGLPVVATRAGDVPHVLDRQSGTVVDPGSSEQLAAALKPLLVDSRLRSEMSEGARKRFRENYGVDAWMRRLLVVYSRACGLQPPACRSPAIPLEALASEQVAS